MRAIIDTRAQGPKIDRHIYGHFSEHLGRCIYGGYWVGEHSPIPNIRGIREDVIKAMQAIRVPNIRWPGGCFADDYHWMDGIGPKSQRAPVVNTHWGGILENNHFGTHEFMDLCEQVGCEPYICGNVGSGTVREMRDWVEYLTDGGNSPMAQLRRKNGRDQAWNIHFWGVGNENWGCGGFMTAQQYAAEFRRYSTYVRNYPAMGKYNWWEAPPLQKIAGGENVEKYSWTKALLEDIPPELLGGISVHCYVKPGQEMNGTVFSEKSWYDTAVNTLAKEPLFRENVKMMDQYDPQNKILLAVDEWGLWVDNEPGTPPGFLYQQNTMRSALCAVLMLHIFHKYARRIRLANLAQTINVLQSILLTEGERLVKTPTYHVFDLLQGHQDAYVLPVVWEQPPKALTDSLSQLDISASLSDDQQEATVSFVNLSTSDGAHLTLSFSGNRPVSAKGRYICGSVNAHNTFSQPENVAVQALESVSCEGDSVCVRIAPCAIGSLTVRFS